jgi:hypothetical protein
VWLEQLTTVEQADAITEGRNGLAGFLPVDRVREIRADPDDPAKSNLDVQWERASVAAPGSDGHCGITGLRQTRSNSKAAKQQRMSLRVKLAGLANETRVYRIR